MLTYAAIFVFSLYFFSCLVFLLLQNLDKAGFFTTRSREDLDVQSMERGIVVDEDHEGGRNEEIVVIKGYGTMEGWA